MEIFHFKGFNKTSEFHALMEKLDREETKHIAGFCHKLQRFYIIVWN